MRWIVTYKGGALFNQADGLFAIDKIRKLGVVKGNGRNWRYLGIAIQPEDYVIFETNLEIEPPPASAESLTSWNKEFEELQNKIMLDVITELEKNSLQPGIIDLMARFGFSEP